MGGGVEVSSDLLIGLVAGGGVGFVLGYVTNQMRTTRKIAEKALREAKQAHDEVLREHQARTDDE